MIYRSQPLTVPSPPKPVTIVRVYRGLDGLAFAMLVIALILTLCLGVAWVGHGSLPWVGRLAVLVAVVDALTALAVREAVFATNFKDPTEEFGTDRAP